MAEQFRGDQRRRKCGTVHTDEGTSGPVRAFVHGAGDELLAGTGLSRDEDGGVGGSDFGNPREHGLQRLGRADNLLEHRGAIHFVPQRQVLAIAADP